jgi:Zn-dependent protease/CBS domain-containing protein
MESASIKLGSIRGVPIGASWSLLVVALVLGTGLAQSRYPSTHLGYATSTYWIAAGVTVVAFFASILAHEVGHAFVARARGLEVDGITLWFLGGVTRMHGEIDGPGADAGIAALGPITSGALGGGFWLVAQVAPDAGVDPLAVAVLEWLALINLALAVFNALPAAPLDGGSVLAAAVWWRTGDRGRGREVATSCGQVLGGGLVAYGLWDLLVNGSDGGVWMLLVGWFIFQAARSEQASTRSAVSTTPSSVTMAELAAPDPPVVDESATIDDLISMLGSIGQHSAFAVRDSTGVLSSVVLVEDLRNVPAEGRASTSARAIALPLADHAAAWSTDDWADVRERVADAGARAVAVYDPGMRLRSIVTRTDVARHVQRSDARRGAGTVSDAG